MSLRKVFFAISGTYIIVRIGDLFNVAGVGYSPLPLHVLLIIVNSFGGPEESAGQTNLLIFAGCNRAFLAGFLSRHHKYWPTAAVTTAHCDAAGTWLCSRSLPWNHPSPEPHWRIHPGMSTYSL